MKRFRRLRAFLRGDFREAFAAPPPELPPEPPPERPARTGAQRTPYPWEPEPRTTDLPKGWTFEALGNTGTPLRANPDPTDREIAGADRIVVAYTDSMGKTYRTIHGADSRRQVGKLITYVTIPNSPPR